MKTTNNQFQCFIATIILSFFFFTAPPNVKVKVIFIITVRVITGLMELNLLGEDKEGGHLIFVKRKGGNFRPVVKAILKGDQKPGENYDNSIIDKKSIFLKKELLKGAFSKKY